MTPRERREAVAYATCFYFFRPEPRWCQPARWVALIAGLAVIGWTLLQRL